MRLFLSILFTIAAHLAAAAAPQPAGYIVAYSLQGDDLAKGTAVIRDGRELAPQIYMPLFDGDAVFVRDSASSVTLDLAAGRKELGGAVMRLDIAGALSTSDDAWAIMTSLGELLTGSGQDELPTNLIAKGTGISLPGAAPGATNELVAEGGPVRLAWFGGEGPFAVSLEAAGVVRDLGSTNERAFSFAPPASGRFALLIADAANSRVKLRFRIRAAGPAAPADILAAAPAGDMRSAVAAVWLARQGEGAWRVEAQRRLGDSRGNARLRAALAAGWPD